MAVTRDVLEAIHQRRSSANPGSDLFATINPWALSAAEIAHSVTPTDFSYPELDVRRYGAKCDGITDDSAALHSADVVAGGTRSIIAVPTMLIGTVTVVSSPLVDTMAQIFTVTSQVTLAGCSYNRPEWFGAAAGNIALAVNALTAAGGIIKLENKTYLPSYNTASTYLTKQNVTLEGVGAPAFNSATAPTGYVAGSGTIIQGPFIVYASGFKIKGGIGIDSSAAVCAALYSGVVQDGFIHFQPNPGSPLAPTVDMQIDDLRGLCAGPSAMVHAVLLENISFVKAKCIEAASAYHCVVSKGVAQQIGMIRAYNPGGEGYYCKSDSYAQGGAIQVGEVQVIGTAGVTSWGVLIQGATQVLSNVQIGRIQAGNCSQGLSVSNGGFAVTDVTIGEIITEACTWGVQFDNAIRTKIGILIANNGQYAFTNTNVSSDKSCRIGAVNAAVMSGDALNLSGSITIGSLFCDTVTGFAVNYAGAGARCFLEGAITYLNPPTAGLTNINVAFLNSWANFGSGNSPFGVTLARGKVCFSGLIHSGTAAGIATLSAQVFPPSNLRLLGGGFNGSANASCEILIGSAGGLNCTNFAAASTYLSLDGVEYPIPY